MTCIIEWSYDAILSVILLYWSCGARISGEAISNHRMQGMHEMIWIIFLFHDDYSISFLQCMCRGILAGISLIDIVYGVMKGGGWKTLGVNWFQR